MSAAAGTTAFMVTQEEAVMRVKEGVEIFDYFGRSAHIQAGPECSFLDYGSRRVTGAHFHPVDQFQVFFGAPGALYQRTEISRAFLHYADAYVTYGPFSSADDPIQFFTLRSAPSAFTAYMPEGRRRLLYRGRRHYNCDLAPLLAEDPPVRGEFRTRTLIEPADDGLVAHLCTATAEGGIPTEFFASPGINGIQLCVLEGEMSWRGRRYGSRSLAWIGRDADVESLRLGAAEGAPLRFLFLRYPSPSTVAAHASEGSAT